jgi:hypothetical protein
MSKWPAAPRRAAEDVSARLAALDPDECWARLASVGIGRVGVTTDDGTVLVLPVNFLVDSGTVVFRTAPGAVLDHLRPGPITFEADGTDPYRRVGWSVLVHGHVTIDTEPCEHGAAPQPWAGQHRRHLVRLRAERVTGRELHPAEHDFDARGYL